MGPVTQEDLVARRILRLTELGLYVSTDYIQEHGTPSSPADLDKHEGLRHLKLPQWRLIDQRSGEVESVSPSGRISVANFNAIQKLCLAGMGICIWHEWRARKLVEEGQLQRVLPQWTLEPWEFFAVTTSRHVPAKARALIEFLVAKESS